MFAGKSKGDSVVKIRGNFKSVNIKKHIKEI